MILYTAILPWTPALQILTSVPWALTPVHMAVRTHKAPTPAPVRTDTPSIQMDAHAGVRNYCKDSTELGIEVAVYLQILMSAHWGHTDVYRPVLTLLVVTHVAAILATC